MLQSVVIVLLLVRNNAGRTFPDGLNLTSVTCYSSEEKQLVIKYVMDRYANMRGTYFVKYMSGSQCACATDAQVASLATRTKVITAVASSKAKAAQKLWASAGESVIEHSLQFDIADVNK